MNLEDIKEFSKQISANIEFDKNLKQTNWFNIGGKCKIFFKPSSLTELKNFLKLYNNRGKIFTIGAGSNVLFSDEDYEGVVIKLGKMFSNISLKDETTIIAGSSSTDKQLSEFAKNNGISGFEFLSCIPGSIGGGIKMNAGCFKNEFKDILLSVQAIDMDGNIRAINASKIKFDYRKSDFSKDLIFLSATFRGKKGNIQLIEKQINDMKAKKNLAQPSKIKTSGSTFKNPVNQTKKKVWELIKESVPLDTKFGGACISKKHCNFFVNENNANFDDMNNLINFVKDKVKKKTGIDLELEIVRVI